MQFKALVPLFLTSLAAAEQATPAEQAAINSVLEAAGAVAMNNILGGTEIGKLLGDLTSGFNRLDALWNGMTAANVASTMDKLVAEGSRFNDVLKKDADTLKNSKPVSGLGDIFPLISKIGPLIGAVNKTLIHTNDKKQLVKDAKLTNKVHDGLYAAEPGIVSLVVSLGSQIQLPAPKASSTAAAADPAATPRPKFVLSETNAKPLVDGALDFVVGVFDGSIDVAEIGKQIQGIAGSLGLGKGKKSGGSGGSPAAAGVMSAPAAAPAAGGHSSGGHGSMPGMNMKRKAVEFEA